tara:strand:- start:5567 stop:5920 length:354 start_codon:yes stop_codon:yes gene_type:complete
MNLKKAQIISDLYDELHIVNEELEALGVVAKKILDDELETELTITYKDSQNKETNDIFSTTTTVFMNTNFVYSNGTTEPMEHFSIDLTDTQTLQVVGMLISNKQQQRDRLMNELSKL